MDIISTIQVALYDFIFARKNIRFPLVIIIIIIIAVRNEINVTSLYQTKR